MASSRATIGILSIGDMGLGIAKLLMAHEYHVVTSAVGRSPATNARVESASITNLGTDEDFVSQSDIILSIVPPRDALATAKRIANAIKISASSTGPNSNNSKIFIDLNAISPASARTIAALFPSAPRGEGMASPMRFLDGGIIGGPPRFNPETKEWSKPSLVVSGPVDLTSNSPTTTTTQETTISPAPTFGPHFSSTLNMTHISADIGPASGLKCCFASLTKGLIALSILSYTTANNLGVLGHLKDHLETITPKTAQLIAGSITSMAPKAYRWVDEMREISKCFRNDGGFTTTEEEGGGGSATSREAPTSDTDDLGLDKAGQAYDGFAEIYRFVARGTVLGEEVTGKRKRGLSEEDVAVLMGEGLGKRKRYGKNQVR